MEIKISDDFQDLIDRLIRTGNTRIGNLIIAESHLINIDNKSEKIKNAGWNQTGVKKLTIDRLPRNEGNCYEIMLKDGNVWFNIYEKGGYDYILYRFVQGEYHGETEHSSMEEALDAAVKFHNQMKIWEKIKK